MKNKKNIDWEHLLNIGKLANNIYDTNTFLNEIKEDFDYVYVNDNIDTPFAILCDTPKSDIFIVFRGTENIHNWITNLDISLSFSEDFDGPDCKVHNGFFLAYKKIRENLFTFLNSARSQCQNKCKLTVVGHSLGGALSQLFVADNCLFTEHFSQVSCVTFGSPKVGNYKFVKNLTKKMNDGEGLVRFQCCNDFVTRLPFSLWCRYNLPFPLWCGYRHAGKSYYFDRNGIFYKNVNFFRMLWNQIIDRTWGGHLLSGIYSHNMLKYLECINKNI